MVDTLAPGFLIAVPGLADPNFRQSVVLLLQQDESGAMGLVINHDSPLLLRELCQDHEIPYAGDPDKRVRRGGPVQPEQGLVLYGGEHDDPEGRPVVHGLNLSASRGTLVRLCSLRRARFQCFAGYAGWGPGQLEREIGEGTWIVAPAQIEVVFEDSGAIWASTLRNIGIDPAAVVPGAAGEA